MDMQFVKQLRTIVAIALLTAALGGCDSPEQKESRFIKRGNGLFDQGELEKARLEYKNASQLKPADAEPYYRIGLIDEAEGDLHNAFTNFTQAERQNAHFHPAVLKLAQYFMAAENYDETRKRLDAVLAEAPGDPEAHALSAGLLLREKKFDESEKEAKQALAADPANISACSALTGLYVAENKNDQAIATVNEGIARNPTNLALLLLRVLVYGEMNDLAKVAEGYQAIFKLKPDQSQFRVDLASIYIKNNQIDQAEAVLRDGIKAVPDDWQLKHQLVLFLDEHRGSDAAEREIRGLMEAFPKNESPTFWLGDLYIKHDQTDKAVALLQQLVTAQQLDPPALNARTALARIAIARGDQPLAQKLVDAVLAKDGDNHAALFVRANLEFANGAYQDAVSDLRKILRESPKTPEALQVLAEILLLQGRTDLAIDTMQKLAELAPDNMTIRVRIAQLIYANGDHRRATELIAMVNQTDPKLGVGWETAARFAIQSKEWLPAEEAIKKLDQIEGQHLTAEFLEGQVLAGNGNDAQALEKYKEVIAAGPSTPLAGFAIEELVDIYRAQKHIDQAIAYLEGMQSDSPVILTVIGKCYVLSNNPGAAGAAFDKAIAASSPFSDPYIERAKLFMQAKESDKAIETLKKGAQAVPGDLRIPIMQASLESQAGQYKDAIEIYQGILAKNPGFDAAANNFAELVADYQFSDPGALEKARQAAERFSGSKNPLLLDTIAWVYFRQGNDQLAQTLIERALQLEGQHPPQMHYHYAVILNKGGKTEQAKEEFKKSIEGDANYPGIENAKRIVAGGE